MNASSPDDVSRSSEPLSGAPRLVASPYLHFDGWQVDATSGGTTRSATVLTPTASLDVTGLANPITVTVRGRNRLAGLGDPATRILP